MSQRCAQCESKIEEGRGHATEHGQQLCSACYFAIWGPRDAYDLARAVEDLGVVPRQQRSAW